MSDATKAMQQLDQMDIAGQKLGVKIAPMSAGETAQLAAAAARVDLDDEGMPIALHPTPSVILLTMGRPSTNPPAL